MALLLERAKEVEACVYLEFNKDVGAPYRSKIRSLHLNLKDKKNPGLREAVVSGEIAASRLCNMSVQAGRHFSFFPM